MLSVILNWLDKIFSYSPPAPPPSATWRVRINGKERVYGVRREVRQRGKV